MTPSVPEVIRGCTIALATPPPPESAGDFAAGRVGLVSTLLMLCAVEANVCVAATIAENADIRGLFANARSGDAALDGRLAEAAGETDTDLTIAGLDAANARLRRLLIELHEQVETAGDRALNRQIAQLYVRMARGRRMELGRG
jgi:hypothetical protein